MARIYFTKFHKSKYPQLYNNHNFYDVSIQPAFLIYRKGFGVSYSYKTYFILFSWGIICTGH